MAEETDKTGGVLDNHCWIEIFHIVTAETKFEEETPQTLLAMHMDRISENEKSLIEFVMSVAVDWKMKFSYHHDERIARLMLSNGHRPGSPMIKKVSRRPISRVYAYVSDAHAVQYALMK